MSSKYTSPRTSPSGPKILKVPTSTELELASGSYLVRPRHSVMQSGPGRIKSALPVSKLTVKLCVGLPTVMRPCHSEPPFSAMSSSALYADLLLVVRLCRLLESG